MVEDTLLSISVMGLPPYSIRGVTQTLQPIAAAGSLRRTINGVLTDLSQSQFRKYASSLSCSDVDPPAFDGIWQGQTVVVDCVVELCYPTSSAGPSRTVVPGSEREADGFTFYRPRLTMKVVSLNVSKDEWGAVNGWQLDLEEV